MNARQFKKKRQPTAGRSLFNLEASMILKSSGVAGILLMIEEVLGPDELFVALSTSRDEDVEPWHCKDHAHFIGLLM